MGILPIFTFVRGKVQESIFLPLSCILLLS